MNVTRKILLVLAAVLLLQLLVPLTASAAPSPSGSCSYYTVRWGDTLAAIARRYGDNWWSIATRNGIANPNYIRAGQVLLVCSAAPPPAPSPVYHRVQWGQTLWSIANWYGTTPWAIASLNGIYNMNLIYAGQVLRIR